MSGLAEVPAHPRRLVYLGTPAMAVPPLEALIHHGFDVALVVTRIDKRRGRGSELSPSPVKAAAHRLGVPVSHRVEDALEVGADLGVVVAFGQLIKRSALERLPMVNIHFSLLPRWRGAAPVERALLAGDHETGTCLMQLEEGLDTGPVFDRVVVPIRPDTTADDLRSELVAAGTEQLVRCLRTGLVEPTPQSGEPTYAAKLSPADFELHWDRPGEELLRIVRLGGAHTTFRGKRLKIAEATVVTDGCERLEPGAISGGRVGTGTVPLRLVRVQPEGKPVLDATAWRNGARPAADERFGDR